MILYVTGAYGRTANLKDWEDGKDFRITHVDKFQNGIIDAAKTYIDKSGIEGWNGGKYFSKRDRQYLLKHGYREVRFYDAAQYAARGFLIGFKVIL